MTDKEKSRIEELRKERMGYGRIAKILGISDNTVKSFCRRNNLTGLYEAPQSPSGEVRPCKCCGKDVRQIAGRKEKKFCSDACRREWWNSHLDRVRRKAVYSYECAYCKKPFTAYGNAKRKYCCRECYIKHRYGGDA